MACSAERARSGGFVVALLNAGSAVVLAGCAAPAPSPPASGSVPVGAISVRASDRACDISAAQAPAGKLTFTVTNAGDVVTGFYLYGTDDRVVGEVEDVGRGLTRLLSVDVPDGGVYTTVCRPGMVGDGIRAPFTVTDAAARSRDGSARLAEAAAGYQRYVATQAEALVPKTQEFADAVEAGDVERAKALFPVARTSYERIESVVRTWGDLAPRIDGREDGPRDPGVAWTGFHRLEKDLWVDGLQPDSAQVAGRLVTDVEELRTRAAALRMGPAQLADSAKELLDEMATGRITDTVDRYSHTELSDFTANVEGAQAAVAALRPVIDEKDPTMGPVLDERFAALEQLLQGYRTGDGYRSYAGLTQDEIKQVTDAVDALSEPLSQVAGVVTA